MSLRSFDGRAPRLGSGAWVDESAVVIGDVDLGADASVWPAVVIRADVNRVRIGALTNIQDGSVLHVNAPSPGRPDGDALTLGARVTVGHHAILHGCTVEDDCLIGMGALVLDGALIRSGVLLAAGALVAPGKVLDGGWLWAGQPARAVRELRPEERERIAQSAVHYAALKERHRRA
jgi:carbonic anhydrase/acetyltransferase-like protein (isoleucine patch superfamily)